MKKQSTTRYIVHQLPAFVVAQHWIKCTVEQEWEQNLFISRPSSLWPRRAFFWDETETLFFRDETETFYIPRRWPRSSWFFTNIVLTSTIQLAPYKDSADWQTDMYSDRCNFSCQNKNATVMFRRRHFESYVSRSLWDSETYFTETETLRSETETRLRH